MVALSNQAMVRLLSLLLAVPICIVFPIQVHLKQNDELKDWTWVWVFWPYWMLASMCLAIAAWSTYRILGPGAGDADILQQSTTLRTYNIGFFLLLTLPLTGACYLDGLVSNQIAFMLPGLAAIAGVAIYLMNRSRPCAGRKSKSRREED